MTTVSILWRSIYLPGHEVCQLSSSDSGWQLTGTALFVHQQQPCRLDYQINCDADWRTRSAQVTGWLGRTAVDLDLMVDSDQRWWINGVERPIVASCIDLDLNFSPSTNLLPIRRFNLAIGQAATVTAAWLRFPSFELEPLDQVYRRVDESTYRYESAHGSFVADLQVNQTGFVIDYPGLWQATGMA